MSNEPAVIVPTWTKNVLYAAAVYNVAWGAVVILAPAAMFRWAEMEQPRYPQIWQCVGMIVGVYGVGYWLAARDPFRHWPIVLVGFLGKILGPIGFLNAAITGTLPWKWGATIITNDLIWWVPFASILYLAFRHNSNTSAGTPPLDLSSALRQQRSHRNASLLELSSARLTLVVFLRHAGCTFCRVTLAKLPDQLKDLDHRGVNLAIVHMGSPMDGTLMIQRYSLHDAHHFSDPHCILYRAFELQRGRFWQLISPRIVTNAIRALINGHGLGKLSGDGFRLSGGFVLVDGKIIADHRAVSADEITDFAALLREAVHGTEEQTAYA